MLGAARQGSGLGFVFRQFATAEIASGAVVPILDQFLPPDKLRAVIEFVQAVNSDPARGAIQGRP